MKRFVLIFLTLSASIACMAQPGIKFSKEVLHLGFVKQGDTLKFQYTFTNTGDQPLVISETKVQCNCTSVDYPKSPIPPKGTGIIKATFTTAHAWDMQDRTIIVTSNANNSPTELHFKCIITKVKDKS